MNVKKYSIKLLYVQQFTFSVKTLLNVFVTQMEWFYEQRPRDRFEGDYL